MATILHFPNEPASLSVVAPSELAATVLHGAKTASSAPIQGAFPPSNIAMWLADKMQMDSSNTGQLQPFAGMHVNTSVVPPPAPLTGYGALFATPHGHQLPTIFSPSLLIVTPAAEHVAFMASSSLVAPVPSPPAAIASQRYLERGTPAVSIAGSNLLGVGESLLPSPTCFTMRHAMSGNTILAPAFAPPQRTMVQMTSILPGASCDMDVVDEAAFDVQPVVQVPDEDSPPRNGRESSAADTLSPGLTHAFAQLGNGATEAATKQELAAEGKAPRRTVATRGRPRRASLASSRMVDMLMDDASMEPAPGVVSGSRVARAVGRRGRAPAGKRARSTHHELEVQNEGEEDSGSDASGVKRARLSPDLAPSAAAPQRLQRKRTGAAIVLSGGVWGALVEPPSDCSHAADRDASSTFRTADESVSAAEEGPDGSATQRSNFVRGRARNQCLLSQAEAQALLTDMLARPVDHGARIENMNPGVKHLQHVIDADTDVPVPDGYLSLDQWMDSRGMRLEFSSVHILKTWFAAPENWRNPYPTDPEKEELSVLTGLSIVQVANWLRNERKRVWLPLKRDAVKKSGRSAGSGLQCKEEDVWSGHVSAPVRATVATSQFDFTTSVDEAAAPVTTFSALLQDIDTFAHSADVEVSGSVADGLAQTTPPDSGSASANVADAHAVAAPVAKPRVRRYKRSNTFV